MFELTVVTHFEAAHCLPGYPGKCARLHGHNWTVEVCVGSEQLDELGMVIDFKVIKQHVMEITEQLDHRYLNELDAWRSKLPTAEHLAQFIYRALRTSVGLDKPNVKVIYVKIWESAGSAVLYREA